MTAIRRMQPLNTSALSAVLKHYTDAFEGKVHLDRFGSPDVLMNLFGVTPAERAASPQYWGRELGTCWERLVRSLFEAHVPGSSGPLRLGANSPCDIVAPGLGIDTKYRLGSGDAGTLKKLAQNAELLRERDLAPVMLFLRDDSLPAARTRMQRAGWRVLEGSASFDFIQQETGQDLSAFLKLHCRVDAPPQGP